MKLVAIALLFAARPGAGSAFSPVLQDTAKAEDLLKDALARAKESKKKVFLTFGSPG
jgi:hypothetical protein